MHPPASIYASKAVGHSVFSVQSFRRKGCIFDTGFHYIGGLRKGEILHPLFQYFHLLDLPWKQLDPENADEVFIGDRHFALANGNEAFVETLAADFPDQREGLQQYVQLLTTAGEHVYDAFTPREADLTQSLFAVPAWKWMEETISDPLLRKVLSGASVKMELRKETLPLYAYAQANNAFLQSTWRLEGGGEQIISSLVHSLGTMGGKVLTGKTVTGLVEEEGRISKVLVGDEVYEADWVISSMHPAATLELVKDSKCLRKIYRKRIAGLTNTAGLFTVNILLKDGALPYRNSNLYLHSEEAPIWDGKPDSLESMLVSYGVPEGWGGKANKDKIGCPAARTIDLLTPMSWGKVAPWQKGEDEGYKAMKEEMAVRCIEKAGHYIPGLEEAVEEYWTSTPLTYQRYTLVPEGSAYGIRKDFDNVMGTILSPKTPVSNLLLTGQNLNMHGVQGVSMTSILTTGMILGLDTVRKDILGK